MIGRIFGWNSNKAVARIHAILENLETLALAIAIVLEVILQRKIASDVAWVALVVVDISSRIYGHRNDRLGEAEKTKLEESLAASEERLNQTNERVVKAEKTATEANLARERLARRFTYRTLNANAYVDLLEALSPLTGTRLDVFAFDSHKGDVLSFAIELTNVSKRAGLDCKLWIPSTDAPRIWSLRTDVVIASAKECTPEQNELSSAISMAFARALVVSGIKPQTVMHGFSMTDPSAPAPAPGTGSWNPSDVAPFRIQIVEREFLNSPFL